MAAGIYNIIGPNSKIYVGSASYLSKRKHNHFDMLRKNEHSNPKLQASYNKYGEETFIFNVIEIVEDKTKLIYYEQIWLDIIFSSLNDDQIYNINRKANSRIGTKRIGTLKESTQQHLDALAIQRAKTYQICYLGEAIQITNLDKFCRENNLSVRGFRRMLSGERSYYKGYTKL